MTRYAVRWASVAVDDLTRIVDYLAAESPINELQEVDFPWNARSTCRGIGDRDPVEHAPLSPGTCLESRPACQ